MNVLVRVEKIKGVGGKADHFHKAVVKRRGALGRKNKSNSNFFFPWAPPSGEKHAVSKGTRSRLNITNFLRYELLQEMLIGECLLARRQLICWKWSSPHKCLFCQCFCWEGGLKPRLGMRGHGWWMLLWDLVSSLCHLQLYWWHYCLSPSLLIWILGSGDFSSCCVTYFFLNFRNCC